MGGKQRTSLFIEKGRQEERPKETKVEKKEEKKTK